MAASTASPVASSYSLVVGVVLVDPVDLPLEDADGRLATPLARLVAVRRDASCLSSVVRNAAGLENSRFLSVLSTNSVAIVSALS